MVSASLSHRMGNIFWDEYQSRLDAAAQLGFDFSDKLKDKPVFLTDQSDWANYTPFVEFSDHYLCRVPPMRWVADEFVHQALADAPEKEKVAQTAILLLDERTRKAFEVNCVGGGCRSRCWGSSTWTGAAAGRWCSPLARRCSAWGRSR